MVGLNFIIGLFSIIFAVGCIDGGYNGIPMNDNWTGFFIGTIVGFTFLIWAVVSQYEDQ